MRFAAVQLDTIAMEVNVNCHKALHWARRAFEGGATHVFFHEGLTADYTPDPIHYGRPLHSHEVHNFSRLAAQYNGTIALGLNEVHEGRPYISCVYLSGRGVEGVYRKSYLWPHEYSSQGREAAYRQTSVPDAGMVRSVLAGDWVAYQRGYRQERASLSTCRLVAQELCVPVVATNRVGFSHGAWMQGGSFILADDGTLVARANENGEEEIVYADWSALRPRHAAQPQAATAAAASTA